MKERLIRFLYILFRAVPIKRNRIVFSSFDCAAYGHNPRVISDYLTKQNKYELIWVLNGDVEPIKEKGIKRVGSHSMKKIYYYATAKVWVDSHHFYNRWKRKGQYLIQTYHAAIPLKKLEGGVPEYFRPGHLRQVQKCSRMTDYQLSNSDIATELIRSGMWYYGPVIQTGMPVNDMLVTINQAGRKEIIEKLGYSQKKKYVLYATTCRQTSAEEKVNELDYDSVTQALSKRFGGEWTVLYRGHPITEASGRENLANEHVIDVTHVQLIQELLCISDVVITDYSSIVTDFMATRKPAFLFAYDYDTYKGRRDFNFALRELPFPLSLDNEGLVRSIRDFKADTYQDKLDALFAKWNFKETGRAAETVAGIIEQITQAD